MKPMKNFWMFKGFLLFLVTLQSCNSSSPEKLRIGWMLRWADVGEVVIALQRAPELASYNKDFEWHPFIFGPEVNEAALAGKVDITLTGLVPAMYLMSKSEAWEVVGKAATFEVATVVQKDLQAQSISDLQGKRIAIPVGGGSHPYFLKRLGDLGLSLGVAERQIQLVNLNPVDQLEAFARRDVDAAATWEPQTTILMNRFGARKIDSQEQVGFVNAHLSQAGAQAAQIQSFLKAYADAIWFVRNNRSITRAWYAEASSTPLHTLESIPTVDSNYSPQLRSREEIDITLSQKHLDLAQDIGEQMLANGLITKEVKLAGRVRKF